MPPVPFSPEYNARVGVLRSAEAQTTFQTISADMTHASASSSEQPTSATTPASNCERAEAPSLTVASARTLEEAPAIVTSTSNISDEKLLQRVLDELALLTRKMDSQ